jgi:hypothetical protein
MQNRLLESIKLFFETSELPQALLTNEPNGRGLCRSPAAFLQMSKLLKRALLSKPALLRYVFHGSR